MAMLITAQSPHYKPLFSTSLADRWIWKVTPWTQQKRPIENWTNVWIAWLISCRTYNEEQTGKPELRSTQVKKAEHTSLCLWTSTPPITSSTPLYPQPSLLSGDLSRDNKQDHLSASGGPDLPYAFPTTNYPPPSRFPPFPRPRRRDGSIPPKDQDNYQETTSIRGKFNGRIEGSLIPKEDDVPPLGAAMSSPPSSHTRAKNPLQAPLRVGPSREALFLPYSMKDLTSLVNSLPPLTKGADNWIRNLVTLTAGDPLCLYTGDCLPDKEGHMSATQ